MEVEEETYGHSHGKSLTLRRMRDTIEGKWIRLPSGCWILYFDKGDDDA